MFVLAPPRGQGASEVAAWGAGFRVLADGQHPNYGQARVPSALTGVTQIAAGGYFSVALNEAGEVWQWGLDSDAQKRPLELIEIAAGQHHTLGLRSDGTVIAWGANYSGQTNVPVGLSNVVAIAAGRAHSLALTADGRLITWGSFELGEAAIPEGCSNVVAIAAGGRVSMALTADDRVLAWGADLYGQTQAPPLSNVVAIKVGERHSLALSTDGKVVAWGSAEGGATQVPENLSGVVAIAAGEGVSYAVTANGTVVRWGSKVFPGAPHGIAEDSGGLSNVVAISVGFEHGLTLVGSPAGSAPAWNGSPNLVAVAGRDFFHRMSARNGVTAFTSTPLPAGLSLDPATGTVSGVPTETGSFPVEFTATNASGSTPWSARIWVRSAALAPISITTRGLVIVPLSSNFRLPIEATASPTSYTAEGLPDGLAMDSRSGVISGQARENGDFTVVVTATSASSQAQGSIRLRVTPVVGINWQSNQRSAVGQLSDVVKVVDEFALTRDGQVLKLLGNEPAPLVIDTPTLASFAVGAFSLIGLTPGGQVVERTENGSWAVREGLSKIVSIAAQQLHFMALDERGWVTSWGVDSDGTSQNPAERVHPTDAAAIAAGAFFDVALRRDGVALVWNETSPVVLASNVIAISAATHHALALRTDGTVAAWSRPTELSPSVSVPTNLPPMIAIAAGEPNLALTEAGSVVAWRNDQASAFVVAESLDHVVGLAGRTGDSFVLMEQAGIPLPRLTWSGTELRGEGTFGLSALLLSRARLTDPWRPTQAIVFTNEVQTLRQLGPETSTQFFQLIRQ